MLCPYCASEVPQAALVCPHCTRDFYLFKPILERMDELEKRISELARAVNMPSDTRILALETEVTALKAKPGSAEAPGIATPPYRRPWISLPVMLFSPVALLVAAHLLLLFVYDVKPLYLRIVSILIPIPFGFALMVWRPYHFRAWVAAGFAMAAIAVLFMLVTTAYLDNVPVMPQSRRDVQEVCEYMASLGLAFLTGLLLGKRRHQRLAAAREPNRLSVLVAELFTSNKDGELGVVRLANRINKTVGAFTPIATGTAAVYAGIKALLASIG